MHDLIQDNVFLASLFLLSFILKAENRKSFMKMDKI